MRRAMKPRRRWGCRWWRELRPRQNLKKLWWSEHLKRRIRHSQRIAFGIAGVHQVKQVVIWCDDQHRIRRDREIDVNSVLRIPGIRKRFRKSLQKHGSGRKVG